MPISKLHRMQPCRTTAALIALAVGLADISVTSAFAQSAQIEEIIVSTRKRTENLQSVPMAVSVLSDDVIERMNVSSLNAVTNLNTSLSIDQGASPLGTRLGIRGLTVSRGRPNMAIMIDGIDVTTEGVTFVGAGALPSQKLLDLARIEVVKGPQSALYGRSAFGGAIQYITKGPSDTFEGRVNADVGDYGRYDISGSISGPVSDKLGLRLNANYWSKEGFYTDQATFSNTGGGEGYGLALSGKLTASDTFSVRARVEYTDEEKDQSSQTILPTNTILRAPASAIAGGLFTTSTVRAFLGELPSAKSLQVALSPNPVTGEIYPGTTMQVLRGSIVAEWDADFGRLNSWTGYTYGKDSVYQDGDQDAILAVVGGRTIDISRRGSHANFNDKTEQFSQELRYETKLDGPFQVTVGGLYWYENAQQFTNTISVSCSATSCPAAANFTTIIANALSSPARPSTRTLNHYSAYGHIEWDIIDNVRFTAEARLSHENEAIQGLSCALPRIGTVNCADPFAPTVAVFGPSSLMRDNRSQAPYKVLGTSGSENFTTPRFIVEWQAADDAMLYVSAAKGVKPGGTSTVTGGTWIDARSDGDVSEFQYAAEKLWVYELGAKTEWLDNRLIANAAFFYQDYTDKQVATLIPVPNTDFNTARIINAGQARVKGMELETVAQATENLRLSASYTYLNAKYTKFDYLTASSNEVIRNGNCEVVRSNGVAICSTSLTGRRLEGAPRHALVMSANYTASAATLLGDDAEWFIEGDSRYQSRRFIEASNNRTLSSYWLLNARVGVTRDQWEVLFYVDNVTDNRTVKSALRDSGTVEQARFNTAAPPDTLLVNLPDPRTVGIRAKVNF